MNSTATPEGAAQIPATAMTCMRCGSRYGFTKCTPECLEASKAEGRDLVAAAAAQSSEERVIVTDDFDLPTFATPFSVSLADERAREKQILRGALTEGATVVQYAEMLQREIDDHPNRFVMRVIDMERRLATLEQRFAQDLAARGETL